MNRREQIEEAAKENVKPFWIQGIDENALIRGGFVIGAEWADQHPLITVASISGTPKVGLVEDYRDQLREQLSVAVEALEFYSKAQILFCSFDGNMPSATSEEFGVMSGFNATETHVKDDGQRAKQALEKIKGMEK